MYYFIISGVINYKVNIKSVSIYLSLNYLLKFQWIMELHLLFVVCLTKLIKSKPMEILTGERTCYILLSFVCFKMELGGGGCKPCSDEVGRSDR